MKDRAVNRWMGPAGIVILVLVFLVFGPLTGDAPGQNASGPSVVSFWNAHQTQGWLQIYLGGLALVLTLFYVSHLRTVLSSGSDGRRFLPNAAFGGGLLFVSGFVVTGSFHMTLLLAAHNHQYAISRVINFYDQNDYLLILIGIAALTLAAGASILQGSLLPKWLGVVSIVIAVLSVAGPLSFVGLIAGGIWLPVLGFVIQVKTKSEAGNLRAVTTDVPPPAVAAR